MNNDYINVQDYNRNVENDSRVKMSKELLKLAFIQLLQEKSFSEITINEITIKAGVARNTFYNHFQDKSKLLDYIFEELIGEINNEIRVELNKLKDNELNKKEIINTFSYVIIHYIYNIRKELLAIIQKDKYKDLYWYIIKFINRILKEILPTYKDIFLYTDSEEDNFYINFFSAGFINSIYSCLPNNISEENIKKYIKNYLNFKYDE